jgi:hypothetical protein
MSSYSVDWQFLGFVGTLIGTVFAILSLLYTIFKDWPEIESRRLGRTIFFIFGIISGAKCGAIYMEGEPLEPLICGSFLMAMVGGFAGFILDKVDK